ncbi:hypothetical protein E8D34_04760 [Nocardioides sp. GY 10113]|uniref:hypothetical protein n=1 Tax=Nocardioides sp. GY 10113 TaxID=2569761 RepID=UPI0010A94A81|nr:hypothetical protein [Nocardioides sp. GY 10113]TIC88254.1 hypothetical protein E8D34_04760 [Nocardioides sp. GY 10113]
MSDEKPGERPEPKVEEREPAPGGADAVVHGSGPQAETGEPEPLVRDARPRGNPSIDEAPEAIKEEVEGGEDTTTRATRSDEVEDSSPEESPA